MKKNLVVHGSSGKMGKMLLSCLADHPTFTVSGKVGKTGGLAECIEAADVIVDFSYFDCTHSLVEVCAGYKKPVVIGTTGHTPEERERIQKHASSIPIVWTSNFSKGVTALLWLTCKAAEILGPDCDLEVVEMHHRAKKDAPSGTAASLAKVLAEVRGHQLESVARHGRHGITGVRTPTEIGIHSIRGGDVVGDHTVMFAAQGERLELTHKASSRETFARGALHAAEWVMGKRSGLYNMADVLGLPK